MDDGKLSILLEFEDDEHENLDFLLEVDSWLICYNSSVISMNLDTNVA